MGMEPPPSYSYSLFPFLSLHCHPQMQDSIFFSLFFTFLSLLFLSFSLSFYKRFSKKQLNHNHCAPDQVQNDPTHLTGSLLFDVLPPDSARWANLPRDPDSGPGGEHKGNKRKKKKKSKKKRTNSGAEEEENGAVGKTKTGSDSGLRIEPEYIYPFTSSSSFMQRKIKQPYDELVKCNESKTLSLTQVVQFAHSLVEARKELQHKADVIKRKFVITKALLCKADRSCFDRLHQQIYKLELEQKRLEEDAFVYNLLQQQLKLSPAYEKMLELGARVEKEEFSELGENKDDDFADISFEELLAQEKKDSFWQKNGKSRLYPQDNSNTS